MKIAYTSDLHGYFFPTDYLDRDKKNIGLFSLADELKNYDLLLDAGDVLQGSALDYYLVKKNSPETIASIMNDIGYDAITLGNHDFNFGYEYLKNYVNNLNAIVICANVEDLKSELSIEKSHIFERCGLKIGVIGIVTDWIKTWEKPENIKNFKITDPIIAARDEFENIKNCDIKICLYHGGYDFDVKTGEINSTTGENIGSKILEELDFDILLTGHQHMKVDGFVKNSTLTMQVPSNGMCAGAIDISNKNSYFIEPIEPNSELMKKYSNIGNEVQDFLDKEIAILDRDYLPEERLEMAINGSSLADLINKIQLEYFDADISITSFANEISGLRKNLTIRDILNTYRFSNNLLLVEIDGKNLKLAIEKNLEYIDYEKSTDTFSISKSYTENKLEHYNFDFFYGIDIDVDLKRDLGNRVLKISKDGVEISESDVFKIAMNNYRKTGAGGFYMYKDLKVLKSSGVDVSDILIEYFEKNF